MTDPKDDVTIPDSEAEALHGDSSVDESLAQKLADVEARLRAVSGAYKQAKEEIETTKTRLERNAVIREEIRKAEVVSTLFEPVENLQRCIGSLTGVAPEAAQGLGMVHQQFMAALSALGLEEVGAEGQRFDPNQHEAILSQPVPDPSADGLVLSVFSKGYRIPSRVIRPARVVIGVYSPPVTPEA
jgi:molecular chaperone GrpE